MMRLDPYRAAAAASLAINFDQDEDGVLLQFPAVVDSYTITGWLRFRTRSDGLEAPAVYIRGEPVVGAICTHVLKLARLNDAWGVNFDDNCDVSDSANFAESPLPETWVFFALTREAAMLTGYWAELAEQSFDVDRIVSCDSQALDMAGAFAQGLSAVGKDGNTDIVADVDMTQVRQWTRVLNPAELIAEKNSRSVVSPTSLFASNPLQGAGDMSDESGNGRTSSATGVLTTVAGPAN